jgi:hypothetical protein
MIAGSVAIELVILILIEDKLFQTYYYRILLFIVNINYLSQISLIGIISIFANRLIVKTCVQNTSSITNLVKSDRKLLFVLIYFFNPI